MPTGSHKRWSIVLAVGLTVFAAGSGFAQDLKNGRLVALYGKNVFPFGLEPRVYKNYDLTNHVQFKNIIRFTEKQNNDFQSLATRSCEPESEEIERLADERRRLQLARKWDEAGEKRYVEKVSPLQKQLWAKRERALRDVTTDEQAVRLEELRLQASGPAAFLREDVRQKLGLAPAQIATIDAQFAEGVERMKQVTKVPEDVFLSIRAHNETPEIQAYVKASQLNLMEARGDLERDVLAVLTPEQRMKYESWLGVPYNIAAGPQR